VPATRNALLYGAAQFGHKHVSLVGAHHRHTPEWVGLQQSGEGVAVLAVRVQSLELVAHEFERLMQTMREGSSCDVVDCDCKFASLLDALNLY
jgi:hypothetical protein